MAKKRISTLRLYSYMSLFFVAGTAAVVVFLSSPYSPLRPWQPSDPFPKECNGSYTAALLDTITKECTDLRVTAVGRDLRKAVMERNESRACQEKAWQRIQLERLRFIELAKGDQARAMELWCGTAREFLQTTYSGNSRYLIIGERQSPK